jgi:hypothetical protein
MSCKVYQGRSVRFINPTSSGIGITKSWSNPGQVRFRRDDVNLPMAGTVETAPIVRTSHGIRPRAVGRTGASA